MEKAMTIEEKANTLIGCANVGGCKSQLVNYCQRSCNQQEISYLTVKFRKILGEIDTAKLKYIEYCWYNSTECFDYYEEEKKYKPMTLNEAIAHAKEVAASKCDDCSKEHTQLAEWLQELQGYKDKTYITADFLACNGFKTRKYDFLYCDDVEEISAQCIDAEMGVWRVEVGFLDHCENVESLDICTVGQLRMFLAIEGLDNIIKQLK